MMTKKVLIVHASPPKNPRAQQSKSRLLADHFATLWAEKFGGAEKFGANSIIHHDTCALNLPHLVDGLDDDLNTAPDSIQSLSPARQRHWQQCHALIDDIMGVDTIAVFSPLWNFGMPSHLKAWVETVSRDGRLFSYDDINGLTGSLTKHQGLIVATMGGAYDDNDPEGHWNHLTPSMKTVFEFWGMPQDTIHHIHATELDICENSAKINMQRAKRAIVDYINNFD